MLCPALIPYRICVTTIGVPAFFGALTPVGALFIFIIFKRGVHKMYTDIGKKIKILAMVTAAIGAFLSVVGGIFIIADGGDFEDAIIGLLVMMIGILAAWVSSWILYGFGELIDKTSDIESRLAGGLSETEEKEETVTVDAEKIAKIKSLYSAGLLSEDEYKAAIYRAGGIV